MSELGLEQSTRKEPRREKLTTALLDRLRNTRPRQQYIVWDTVEKGFHVLISPGPKHEKRATVTLRVAYYLKDKPGVPKYLKLGRYPDGTISRIRTNDKGAETKVEESCADLTAMRGIARNKREAARDGQDPKREIAAGKTFNDNVRRYLERPQQNPQLSRAEIERIFQRYVLPEWGNRKVEDIDTPDVADLLTKIACKQIKGPKGKMIGTFNVARATRVQLSSFFNWYIANCRGRNSRFVSPIVRDKNWKQGKGRERCLSDDEIRALWTATGELGVYGAVIRMALLTMQRFHKVSGMLKADLKAKIRIDGHDIEVEDVWDPTRATDPENKLASKVPLSSLARKVLNELPEMDGKNVEGCVFTLKGDGPLEGWSKFKKRLDALMQKELTAKGIEFKPWQHRDLRRTARTLMARAEVNSDIAEHAMGHKPPKILGTYDRHHYLREKQEAFQKLSDKIESIINPPEGKEAVLRP
jgi:hypothetical protein